MRIRFSVILFTAILFTLTPKSAFSLTLAEQAKEYRDKGYKAQEAGNLEDAITCYQKAATLKEDYATPHNDLGILYETKGWLDRAEEEYKKTLAIDPNYIKAHANLALLYERKGELEKAAFYWMKRYRLGSPDDEWTKTAKERLEKLGLMEKETSARKAGGYVGPDVTKVVKKEQSRTKEEPKSKPAGPESKWARIGGERQQEFEEEKAREGKKQMAKIQPASRTQVTGEDIRRKQLEASLKLAEERLREEKRKEQVTTTKSARKYFEEARVFYQKGEYIHALDSLKKAKEISPDDPSIYELENEVKNQMKEERIGDHYNEGMMYFRKKDFSKAKEEFEAILSILPE